MKRPISYLAVIFFVFAAASRAQSVGRIDCPRSDGVVYLYNSMTTLEISTTLQCGEQVQITGRYDHYFGVRTAKGQVGYVPVGAVLLFKNTEGGPTVPQPIAPPNRERVVYDPPAPAPAAPAVQASASDFTMRSNTVIHLKLAKPLSSAGAKLGDHVDLEVAEDLVVDGIVVVAKGAAAVGTVTDVETKKHLGHGGKLGVSLNSVRLASNDSAPIRGYQEAQGASSTAGAVLPMVSGKDVAFAAGTAFTAWVDGDVHLKKEAFAASKQDAAASSAPPGHN